MQDLYFQKRIVPYQITIEIGSIVFKYYLTVHIILYILTNCASLKWGRAIIL